MYFWGGSNWSLPTGGLANGMPRYSETWVLFAPAWPFTGPLDVWTLCPTVQWFLSYRLSWGKGRTCAAKPRMSVIQNFIVINRKCSILIDLTLRGREHYYYLSLFVWPRNVRPREFWYSCSHSLQLHLAITATLPRMPLDTQRLKGSLQPTLVPRYKSVAALIALKLYTSIGLHDIQTPWYSQ